MKSCRVVYIRPVIIIDVRDKGKRFHPDEHAETATTFLGGQVARVVLNEARRPVSHGHAETAGVSICLARAARLAVGERPVPRVHVSEGRARKRSPSPCAHTHHRTYAGNRSRPVRCGTSVSQARAKETTRYTASIRILPAEGYSPSPASSLPVMVSSSYLVSSRRYSALLSRFCQTWSVNSFGTTLSTLPIAWSPSHCVA